MQLPVNFDSVSLESMLGDWLLALREHSVEAVVVLGPDPFGTREERLAVAVHPPEIADAAAALAESREFGAPWRDSDAPLVAWQHIAKADHVASNRWRVLALAHGFQTVIRVEFTLPAGRAFECFLFSPRELNNRTEAASLVWSALNIWPLIKRAIANARCPLSPRERECLMLAFEGKTARQSGKLLGCTDRTINFHIANATAKLRVENKMAAIQRAIWFGAI
ncbi:MAG: helix-turn-helix domain-containing protein [Pseudomonadota bacterium]